MLTKYAPFIVLLLLTACSTPDIIVQEWEYVDDVLQQHPDVKHHYIERPQYRLHYAVAGDPHKPALVIIHGTPGDWQQYARYLLDDNLRQHYRVVVIDRPGWGESTVASGAVVTSFKDQARIISALLIQLHQDSKGQPIVIMGHSLGASLAPQIALDYPELVQGLLLFAGALDPALSSPRWYNYAANTFPVNWILSDKLLQSNQEIFALQNNMDAIAERWQGLQTYVIAVQGMQDGLVYPANSDYVEKTLNPQLTQVIRLPTEGNLFPMTLREQVAEWAHELLKRINHPSSFYSSRVP